MFTRGLFLSSKGLNAQAFHVFRQALRQVETMQSAHGNGQNSNSLKENNFQVKMAAPESHEILVASTGRLLFDSLQLTTDMDDFLSAELAEPDRNLFIATCLYNIGNCCHAMFLYGSQNAQTLKVAKSVYLLALDIVGAMSVASMRETNAPLLGSALCNNLAALYADLFQLPSMDNCLYCLEQYMEEVPEEAFDLLHANLLFLRDQKLRHAGMA